MGKINGRNLWGKLMGKINGTFQHCKFIKKKFPLAAIKGMGIKYMRVFNGNFSHNENGKKYVNQWGNFIDELALCYIWCFFVHAC